MGGAVPCLQQWKKFFLGVNELFSDRVLTFLHDHLCNGILIHFIFPVILFKLSTVRVHIIPHPRPSSINNGISCGCYSFFIRRVRKIANSDRCELRRIRLSVRMEQLGYHRMNFREICYFEHFSKICQESSSFIKILPK